MAVLAPGVFRGGLVVLLILRYCLLVCGGRLCVCLLLDYYVVLLVVAVLVLVCVVLVRCVGLLVCFVCPLIHDFCCG